LLEARTAYQVANVVGDLELAYRLASATLEWSKIERLFTVCTCPLCVNNTLGDTLAIEMGKEVD